MEEPDRVLWDNPEFWSRAVANVRAGSLSRLTFAEQRPYTETDFITHFDGSLVALKSALTICETVEPEVVVSSADLLKHFVVSVLLLCAENSQKSDWTKMEHIQLSYRVLKALKSRIFGVDSIHLILLNWSDSDQIYRWCLDDLRPKLVEKRWKEYPGAQQSLVWILNQVTAAHKIINTDTEQYSFGGFEESV